MAHFDALDNKAGITLGFAGALIALCPDVQTPARTAALVCLVAAAALATSAFWPRDLPVLRTRRLRDYLMAEEEFTKLTLHDTYLEMLDQAADVLTLKARLLKSAMTLLAAAGLTLALGIALSGGPHG